MSAFAFFGRRRLSRPMLWQSRCSIPGQFRCRNRVHGHGELCGFARDVFTVVVFWEWQIKVRDSPAFKPSTAVSNSGNATLAQDERVVSSRAAFKRTSSDFAHEVDVNLIFAGFTRFVAASYCNTLLAQYVDGTRHVRVGHGAVGTQFPRRTNQRLEFQDELQVGNEVQPAVGVFASTGSMLGVPTT